jgi:hypothetical protein
LTGSMEVMRGLDARMHRQTEATPFFGRLLPRFSARSKASGAGRAIQPGKPISCDSRVMLSSPE